MKAPRLSNLTQFFTQSIDKKQCTIDLTSSSGFNQPDNCVISVSSEFQGEACVFAPESYMKNFVSHIYELCNGNIQYKQLLSTELKRECLLGSKPLTICGNTEITSDRVATMNELCPDANFDAIGADCQDPAVQYSDNFTEVCANLGLIAILCVLVYKMCQYRSQSQSESLASQSGTTNYHTMRDNQPERDAEQGDKFISPDAEDDEDKIKMSSK
jgi:hypothetical protein